MRFFSTKGGSEPYSLQEVCLQGIAPDGGLFLPESFPDLSAVLKNPERNSLEDIAFLVSKPFFGEAVGEKKLREIITDVLSFPIPLVHVRERLFALELFHGPTAAFKDFGAIFLARILSTIREGEKKELGVIVATSGDTGGAVANGFFRVPGVRVIILYPSGRVSELQERQMCALGENITALEIQGSFDDCQKLAKRLLGDALLRGKYELTSANSINFARLLPQTFYYVQAVREFRRLGLLTDSVPLVVSVPSGNLGNLCAGVIAKRLGLPISRFLLATNRNDVAVQYIQTGHFQPRIPERTYSNAMDVGNPSNLERLISIFGGAAEFRSDVSGSAWQEDQTLDAIRRVFRETGYILDPHGAVGYLALENYAETETDMIGCFLETAHPAKFPECVEAAIGERTEIPPQLQAFHQKEKHSVLLSADYETVRNAVIEEL